MNKRLWVCLLLGAALALAGVACTREGEDPWQQQYDLGAKYLTQESYQEAVVAFEAAIAIDPNRPEAYLQGALAYEALGQVEEARDLLSSAPEELMEGELRREYLRLGRTSDPAYSQLTQDQRDLLTQLAGAVRAEEWETALAIQSSPACRELVNALPLDQKEGRLSVCFYPDDHTRITFFRGTEEGEETSHMDLIWGADGQGGFAASVYSPDHYYMNRVTFDSGAVTGPLVSYNRRWEEGEQQDYTVTGTLEGGVPAGEVLYTFADGRTYTGEGEGFTTWPDWPEELSG